MLHHTYVSGSPPISVLIATRNRARLLETTLLSLCRLSLCHSQWEVIVVDNGSQDGTSSILSNFLNCLPLTVLYEPTQGKCCALNRAIRVARGGILAFTDDDVKVSSAWLSEIYRASSQWVNDKIFCGPICPIYPLGTPSWLQEEPYASLAYGRFVLSAPEGPIRGLPFGANFAVRANALKGLQFSEELGPKGINYRIGGETELLRRLVTQGLRVIYIPSCAVRHIVGAHQTKSSWLLKRSFCYGRGRQYLAGIGQNKDLVFGFPRAAIVSLQKAITQFARSTSQGKRARCSAGSRLAYLLGVLYEYRLMARQLSRHTDSHEEEC
jgi:glycosyltransferase involved in cell wall biosynthesis